jgi:hypothetical protein
VFERTSTKLVHIVPQKESSMLRQEVPKKEEILLPSLYLTFESVVANYLRCLDQNYVKWEGID